nr:hypothetical protein [Martelella sp. AD-3]
MLNESIVIAQAYQPGENWASARERLLAQGASSLPKLASQTRASPGPRAALPAQDRASARATCIPASRKPRSRR